VIKIFLQNVAYLNHIESRQSRLHSSIIYVIHGVSYIQEED